METDNLDHSVILERMETLKLKDNPELIFEVKPGLASHSDVTQPFPIPPCPFEIQGITATGNIFYKARVIFPTKLNFHFQLQQQTETA
jgi:hypothetical protein